ncbi:hypothetical protein BMT54_04200 [Pasteurellaceae bacterium 15-036681]|nr:hypothetical protein BMT54_04200 [Pasteurellaceae bacterium 15-036681]
MNRLGLITNLLLTLVSIAYPLVWLFSSQTGQEASVILGILPYLLALLWAIKARLQAVGWQRYFAMFMTLLLAIVALSRSVGTMYWYPVIINGLMLATFGGSLFSSQSIVERLARLQDPDLPPKGVRYTRTVTQIWCGFFLFNIIVATTLIFTQQYHYWAIFTGVIYYILMGILMAGEWCVRQVVMKK